MTRGRRRLGPHSSSMLKPNVSAVVSRMALAVIGGAGRPLTMSDRTCWPARGSAARRLRLPKAVTRISAPLSSRTLSVTLEAMNSRTSSGTWKGSRSSFFCKMARRVSSSGGWTSVMSPDRKRLRSRSSRVAMDLGGRSEVRTTWRGAVEVVEGVEELLLERLFVLHELDVVDEQDVALAVAALEGHRGVVPDGVDEFVQECLGGDVADSPSAKFSRT